MKRSEVFFGLLRIPLDALGVLAALLLSYRLREANIDLIPRVQLLEPALTLPGFSEYVDTFAIPGVILFLFIAASVKLYALLSTRSAFSEVGRIVIASFLWLVIVIGWFFLVKKQLFYSRILLIHSAFLITLFVLVARSCVVLLQRGFLRSGVGVRLVASLGSKPVIAHAARVLREDIRYNYIGHVPDLAALKKVEKRRHLDLLLQTDPNPRGEETLELIDYCRSHHIGYAFLPPVLADVPHQLRVERLGLMPTMRFQPTPLDGWGRVFKRLFDIVASTALLIVLFPMLFIVAILVVVDSGFPIFYIAARVGGQGRKTFPMIKFRSMVRGADRMKVQLRGRNQRTDGPLFKLKDDPRITPIGKLLRRFDLDELPQLLNVFVGHMSLVGPRPHLPEEVKRYSEPQRRVFAVKPGMTGLAQVSGRSGLTFGEEVKLDLQYVEEWSLWLDLWVLWRTVFVVLARER